MKIRYGFVSNSSSSSFLIPKAYLSPFQIAAIHYHSEIGQALGIKYARDKWTIAETEYYIRGDTTMDNYNISELFDIIGIDYEIVNWDAYGGFQDIDMHDGSKFEGLSIPESDPSSIVSAIYDKFGFETLEKLAGISEEFNKILSDPNNKF